MTAADCTAVRAGGPSRPVATTPAHQPAAGRRPGRLARQRRPAAEPSTARPGHPRRSSRPASAWERGHGPGRSRTRARPRGPTRTAATMGSSSPDRWRRRSRFRRAAVVPDLPPAGGCSDVLNSMSSTPARSRSTTGTPPQAGALPWVNGPSRRSSRAPATRPRAQLGFGGDSRGYLASRVDLTRSPAPSVTPWFIDEHRQRVTFLGWSLDDIKVYTCDPPRRRRPGRSWRSSPAR